MASSCVDVELEIRVAEESSFVEGCSLSQAKRLFVADALRCKIEPKVANSTANG